MKKGHLINQPISSVIAGLGHMDSLVIADSGLPIPDTTQRLDLALTKGIPTFFDTLKAVLSEMEVERVIIAEEMITASPEFYSGLLTLLGETAVSTVSHEEFKRQTGEARAVVRTGEFTPYANVILVSGVVF